MGLKRLKTEGFDFVMIDVDSGIEIFGRPSKHISARVHSNGRIYFYYGDKDYIVGTTDGYYYTELVNGNSGDATFASVASTMTFLRSVVGNFNYAGPSALSTVITADTFSSLPLGTVIGDLAYVKSSEGTAWLPSTLGGTYYPKGWYLWNGVVWISDRNAIAEALQAQEVTSNKKIDVETNKTSDAFYPSIKSIVDWTKTTTIENITLAMANWTLMSGFYEYNYANALILATSVIEVIPYDASIETIRQAEILPMVITAAGTAKIKAKYLPTANIIIAINIKK